MGSIIYDNLKPADAEEIADIFVSAFPETVSVFYKASSPTGPYPAGLYTALKDIFNFYIKKEPGGAFAARVEGKIIGYVLAPLDAGKLKHKFISSKEVFSVLKNFMTGKYNLKFSSLLRIFIDKIAFIFHGAKTGPDIPARILSVAVNPSFQGKGIGKKLTEIGIESLKKRGADKIRLEVRPDNKPAVAVYEKLGFKKVNEYKDTRGVWLVMVKD